MTAPENDKSWWLLTTKPHKEQYAENQLNNQNYITYLPLTKRHRKYRGKMRTTIESLFPRYIFIQLNQTTDNWASIRSTYGVSDFVRFGQHYAYIPNKEIEKLKYEENFLAGKIEELDRFKKGDTVDINEENSIYNGLQGIFQNYDSEQRCSILIEILNKTPRLELPISSLSPH